MDGACIANFLGLGLEPLGDLPQLAACLLSEIQIHLAGRVEVLGTNHTLNKTSPGLLGLPPPPLATTVCLFGEHSVCPVMHF